MSLQTMNAALANITASVPTAAKDVALNLETLLRSGSLSAAQRWGIAAASAIVSRNLPFRYAILAAARLEVDAGLIDDGEAAAALMSMTSVYDRFRDLIGKPNDSEEAARLRVNRLAEPTTSKINLELFCLLVCAINGCAVCLRAHEKVVLEGGLSKDQVREAVRIAAVVHAAGCGPRDSVGEVAVASSGTRAIGTAILCSRCIEPSADEIRRLMKMK